MLWWNVTIFYWQEPVLSAGKLRLCGNWKKKKKNSSSYFLADDSLIKLLCLHVIAFYKDDILPFWDNNHLSKLSPLDTGRKLNVHKTFRRRPGRLLNVLCTFNLRPVSTGSLCQKRPYSELFWFVFSPNAGKYGL